MRLDMNFVCPQKDKPPKMVNLIGRGTTQDEINGFFDWVETEIAKILAEAGLKVYQNTLKPVVNPHRVAALKAFSSAPTDLHGLNWGVVPKN